MEGYNNSIENQNTAAPRGTFLYAGPVLAPNNNSPSSSSAAYGRSSPKIGSLGGGLHLQSECFHPETTSHQQQQQLHHHHHHHHPVVKAETSNGGSQQQQQQQQQYLLQRFQLYDPTLGIREHHHHHQDHQSPFVHRQQQSHEGLSEVEAIKAKIITHPHYSKLLEAYMDCQKVGAPPEVVARLAAARREFEGRQRSSVTGEDHSKDPELDQFMEAYYDMLVKYREELTRPLQEAMEFMRRIETQLNMLSNNGGAPIRVFSSSPPDDKCEGVGSSEEDQDNSGGETEIPEIDPRAEDRELKNHLLRKYSGYLSSLKQELSKKKKKGKLPKDARQKLLTWWELHYKWPYPSETEKVALAESTGLDQKQINNWFINQRKRHWKPSEDMQFMVMDGIHPQNAALYMEGHYWGDGTYRLGP